MSTPKKVHLERTIGPEKEECTEPTTSSSQLEASIKVEVVQNEEEEDIRDYDELPMDSMEIGEDYLSICGDTHSEHVKPEQNQEVEVDKPE